MVDARFFSNCFTTGFKQSFWSTMMQRGAWSSICNSRLDSGLISHAHRKVACLAMANFLKDMFGDSKPSSPPPVPEKLDDTVRPANTFAIASTPNVIDVSNSWKYSMIVARWCSANLFASTRFALVGNRLGFDIAMQAAPGSSQRNTTRHVKTPASTTNYNQNIFRTLDGL